MIPTPEIIAATLRLPLEHRRALAAQPGPGWWTSDTGYCPEGLDGDSSWLLQFDVDALERGFAWLPANDTAWMDAATKDGEAWRIGPYGASIYMVLDEDGGDVDYPARANAAPLCALKRWGVL